MRKNYCKKGHSLEEQNPYIKKDMKSIGQKRNACRVCQNNYTKLWRDSHKEHRKIKAKEYAAKNADIIKKKRTEYYLKNKDRFKIVKQKNWVRLKYGITHKEFDGLVLKQENKCGICKKEMLSDRCVDHDHSTKKVRGLLCRKCNWMIGYSEDDCEKLKMAIIYLQMVR